ncbi:catechol 2,3-dioxygenase [Emcibacter sp.]|uniref:catechol 2,3-dioxygenase n=1 Tax=Emcibacter sp. TaxID=1979954 RepID=UPI002AA8E90C|nr:catechol 2,3-dioxygenase [Emcibacter sp.]
MAVTGVLRPGFCQLRVLDMEESLIHYRDYIGLDEVCREKDGRVYLKASDEFDHHSIILRPADEPGMDCMGFKVLDDTVLNDISAQLKDRGLDVEEIAAGEQPGLGRRIRFQAPMGHYFDFYAEMERSDNGPMVQDPHVWVDPPRGMRPIRFDHCLLYGDALDETMEIFRDVLGFSVSEVIRVNDGTINAYFLSCSTKAHDIALIRYPEKGKFHHCSFLLEDWNDVGHAADIMTRYDISVDIGPTRHGITRGQTIYFFDPSGNRNEVFAGGYAFYPDNPVREWCEDEVGRAIFYYERQLNDRFMGVVT